MDGTTLSAIASAVLSLGFSYIPNLKDWYGRLGQGENGADDGGTQKRLVMLLLLVWVTVAIFGLSCAGLAADLGLPVSCDQPGAVGLIKALVMAMAANQGTYMLTRRGECRNGLNV